MTTPIKPGTRHEMSPPAKGDAELKQLDDLINFLGGVKDSARLRAKEENGVKFLHTRTGTPLGRFWKWLTVGWPGAMEQRKQFRASIKDVLKNIQSNGASDIDLIKDRIAKQTLRVRMFKEFDIHQLRDDLKELRSLAHSREKKSANQASPSSSSTDKKPPVDSEEISSSEDYGFLRLQENEDSLSTTDLVHAKPAKPQKPPKEWKPSNREALFKELDEFSSLMDKPIQLDAKTEKLSPSKVDVPPPKSAEEWRPADPETFFKLKEIDEISEQLDAPIRLDEKELPSKSTETSVPVMVSASDAADFGCTKLTEFLAASKFKPGAYEADAYILPSGDEELRFEYGKISFEEGPIVRTDDGITRTSARHSLVRDGMQRNFMQLQLPALRSAEDSHLATWDKQRQDAYYQHLEKLYSSALSQAFDNGARTFVIKPFSVGLLTEPEIRAFVNGILEFRRSHPETRIQAVFASARQIQMFNKLNAAS